MAKCRLQRICGREADENTGDGLCILHSVNLDKDRRAFDEALQLHRRELGSNFSYFVFPAYADFGEGNFSDATFRGATFTDEANFMGASFDGITDFRQVTFGEELVSFRGAKLTDVSFEGVNFPCCPDFANTQFEGEANFSLAKFAKGVNLHSGEFDGTALFRDTVFGGRSLFTEVTFKGQAILFSAIFTERPDFLRARFGKGADFQWARFHRGARFAKAQFGELADFGLSNFTGDADFGSAEFTQGADFHGATFSEGGNFIDTKFAGPSNFSSAEFLGRMFFASNDKDVPIFSGVEIDFRSVYINPLDVLIIHDADLRRCKFQGTDLRKAAITGVRWSPIPFSETFCRHLCLCQRTGTRFCRLGVYDEISPLSLEQTRSWSHIERQYRELKQNYEDRRDYERAGDFHYGEKEARRNKENRDTPPGLRLWLTLYWLVSGYGERYWRPLLWALVLLLVSTYCYIQWDLLHLKVKGPFADRIIHWWDAGLYSLRVMTLLKPSNFDPVLFWGHLIYVAQSLLGPLLLGLFALALRQRLKR